MLRSAANIYLKLSAGGALFGAAAGAGVSIFTAPFAVENVRERAKAKKTSGESSTTKTAFGDFTSAVEGVAISSAFWITSGAVCGAFPITYPLAKVCDYVMEKNENTQLSKKAPGK